MCSDLKKLGLKRGERAGWGFLLAGILAGGGGGRKDFIIFGGGLWVGQKTKKNFTNLRNRGPRRGGKTISSKGRGGKSAFLPPLRGLRWLRYTPPRTKTFSGPLTEEAQRGKSCGIEEKGGGRCGVSYLL